MELKVIKESYFNKSQLSTIFFCNLSPFPTPIRKYEIQFSRTHNYDLHAHSFFLISKCSYLRHSEGRSWVTVKYPPKNSIFSRPRFIDGDRKSISLSLLPNCIKQMCNKTETPAITPPIRISFHNDWLYTNKECQSITSFLVTNRINSIFTLVG